MSRATRARGRRPGTHAVKAARRSSSPPAEDLRHRDESEPRNELRSQTWTVFLRNRNRRPPVTKTIMLIHGAWFNATSWEGFKARYEAKGYTVVAPSWPHDERSPAELRAAPHEDLRNVGLERILDH